MYIVELLSPYNGYTHASVLYIDIPAAMIHFNLCLEGGVGVREELNTAPFSGNFGVLAADISAELEEHA